MRLISKLKAKEASLRFLGLSFFCLANRQSEEKT
jgi:hypothetical protein